MVCFSGLLAACGGGGGGSGGSSGGGSGGTGGGGSSVSHSPIGSSLAALSFPVTGLAAGQSVTFSSGAGSTTLSQDGSVELQAPGTGTLTIAQQPSGETCEFEIRTSSPNPAGGVFSNLTVGTSVPVAEVQSAPATVNCSVYPAQTPALPQVGVNAKLVPPGQSPQVMPTPIITPVFFSDDPVAAQARESSFLQELVSSRLWSTLSQYGVGGASVTAPIQLSTAAGSSFNRSTTDALLQTHAAAWDGGTLDSRHFFVFFLPNGTTLDVQGAGAYHTAVSVGAGGTLVPYAVVPLPSDPLDQIAAEHEVMEGVADPSGYLGYAQVQGSASDLWAPIVNNSSTEIGDMCEMYTTSESDLSGYVLQPIWSNQAAALFQDPCVPGSAISGGALFGAVPASSAIATLSGYLGSLQGVVVPAGKSVTIPMDLFASSPSVGAITLGAMVKAAYTGSGSYDVSGWSLKVDQQGINGDTVNLSITAPADAGPGLYVVDLTVADNQGQVFFWPLAVATTANYT